MDIDQHDSNGHPAARFGGQGINLVDRGRRLFEFLAQAQMLKTAPARTTDAYLRDGTVIWMANVPVHEGITAAHRSISPEAEQPLLAIDRIPATAAPNIPANVASWLDGPGDDSDHEPQLLQSIPNPTPESPDGADAELSLDDTPDVRSAHQTWQTAWAAWAYRERIDRSVRELYTLLFSSYVKVTSHPEELELVLGVGCLAWAPSGHQPLRRHVLTSPASIAFDDDTGTITVSAQPALETLTVELDMVDPSLVLNPTHINELRARAREFDQHPLDREHTGDLVRRLVHSLDPHSEYHDDDDLPDYSPAPAAAFAPALIVRKRSQMGLFDIFNTIAAQITETGEVPSGLLPLLDPDYVPAAEPDSTDGAVITVDDDVFLPLPLNQVQLDIVRRVDRHTQTLVQGPPGTGKTHTAAALLTHLLAQGKRVLVTAHTDRALKEVRGKLPESIKPLAVAVVGTDRSDMADLKVAVERISARSTDHDSAQADSTIQSRLESIDQLRRRRAQVRHQLVDARHTEVTTYEHAGYRGTLAHIAQEYQARAEQYGWIADFETPAVEVPCPLDTDQARLWLELLRDAALAADEGQALRRLIPLDHVSSPAAFADQVDSEAAGERGIAMLSGLREHAAYETVSGLPADVRSALQARMRELARKAGELEQRHETWMNAALYDIRSGRAATWSARASHLRGLIAATRFNIDSLGPATDVVIDETADRGTLTALAQHLEAHVSSAGPVKTNADGSAKIGALTSKAIKQARPLFDAVRVNAHTPTTAEDFAAVLAHIQAEHQLAALDKAWPADVDIPAEDTLRERLQWHATELEQLDRLLALGNELTAEQHRLAQIGLSRPDWTDMTSVLTYAHLVDAAAAHDAYQAVSRPLEMLRATVDAVCTWADAADVMHHLSLAIRGRDRDQYSAAHARLTRLHAVLQVAGERDALTAHVRQAAPDLAEHVVADPANPTWDDSISNLPAAWDWARTGAWILQQDTADTNVLQAQIDAMESKLRRDIEVLAATRAWDHALSPTRLTGQSRADLTQYAQLVRRLGKGTGKYAVARRGEIRTAMDRCRPAVPVWIMPIYRIAEQLRITQNMFDVVIVDEASQAGLEATFLQYLAPKIVVIGDDKQVSPAAVGVNQQQLRDLANLYLHDDRYKASWQDPKRSLFDEANMRFGSKLTLVEHRRCVPEIIGFSNRIAYEPDNIRLIPVRQYGADRLEPIKVVHVTDGYEKGTSGNKVNPAEVDAIVSQLEKCLADPRYDGLTFGVVSLQGQTQARRIEAELLERIPAEEWTARDLRCGDAADFQGSERDVVFLSMVSAPEPGQRLGSLSAEMYVQRYNVAASRAKDQMWLFHTIGLDQLTNTEDMRHHLLDYCYGVIGRARSADHGLTAAVPDNVDTEPFDSLFEQRVYNRLVDRGFSVIPQFPANGYNIDLVVVGAKARLAIECDGDAWHGPEAYERDLARQRDLERCGWQFFRIRESAFYVDQHAALSRLWKTLSELEIRPSGWLEEELDDAGDDTTGSAAATDFPAYADGLDRTAEPTLPLESHDQATSPAMPSVAERIGAESTPAAVPASPVGLTEPGSVSTPPDLLPYHPFAGELVPALAASRGELLQGLHDIVASEGPVVGFRLHSAYVLASGGRRVGKQIAHALNTVITYAVRTGLLVADNPLGQPGVKPRTYRLPEQDEVTVRQLGPRTLDQVPPLELAHLLRDAASVAGWDSTESLFRDVLHRLGRDRLTVPATATLAAALPLAKSLAGNQEPDG